MSMFGRILNRSRTPLTIVGSALLGVFLSHLFHMPVIDGIASILIGLLLSGVGLLLVFESRGLLIGESTEPDILERISRIVKSDPCVERVLDPLTMHLGPEEVLVTASVDFHDGVSAKTVEDVTAKLQGVIKSRYPEVRHLFIEVQSEAAFRGAE